MEIDAQAVQNMFLMLYPYAKERIEQVKSENLKFAHYTSAFAAIEIISKKQVWLRNSSAMNDFLEVEHGHRCLASAWRDEESGVRLQSLLEKLKGGLSKVLADAFDQRAYERNNESYLIAICEHGNGAIGEEKYGRLSMWRAYGGDTNVAIVFNNKAFMGGSDTLNAFTCPVFYCDEDGFKAEASRVADGLEANMELAHAIGPDGIVGMLQAVFHFVALSTKHPGFAEEREWRTIYSPTIFPSKIINFDVEIINGIPQKVYKLPLQNLPEQGFTGATVPELLEEIIIGPSQHAWEMRDALIEVIQEAGVEDAHSKVRCSDIPLRR